MEEIKPIDLELEKKKLFWKKFNAISNIVLIVWLFIIALYVAIKVGPNIEEFKTLNKDVCRLCEQKTGGVCAKQNYFNQNENSNNPIAGFNISLP